MGGERLDPPAMIDALWAQPLSTGGVAKATGRASTAKTGEALKSLAERRLLIEAPKGGRWRCDGFALAGAAGSVWVNAMVVDPYGVPVPRTQVARRREGWLRDAQAVANDLGSVMSEAVSKLSQRNRRRLIGVGAALPYAVDSDGYVASGVARRASTNVEQTLRKYLRPQCLHLPMWKTRWQYTSDVAGEALAEYRHGRADQRPARRGPAGASPLMLVKAHREIRLSLLASGDDIGQGGVDLGHVRASLDGLDELRHYGLDDSLMASLHERFARPDQLCDVCDSNQCLQLVISPATIYETLERGKEYDLAFDRARTTGSGLARSDQQVFDRIFAPALKDPDGPAAALFRSIGVLLGRALDPIVTVHKPEVLVLTGFLARSEHFRRGVRDALPRHLNYLSVITSSGVRADRGDLPTPLVDPIQRLPHQFWPTSGAARLALDGAVLPWMKERAGAS
jgi:predicted NBD/HSP70 family sugar kinase